MILSRHLGPHSAVTDSRHEGKPKVRIGVDFGLQTSQMVLNSKAKTHLPFILLISHS